MSTETPAFPGDAARPDVPLPSLRDWFAGLAMQALITGAQGITDATADEAYEQADLMLAARQVQR